MNILITGSNGLIGTALNNLLVHHGHSVYLMQRQNSDGDFHWKKNKDHSWKIHWDSSIHIDVVIHLAGESIGKKRWTKEKKQTIYQSRIQTTRALASHFLTLDKPPHTFICASAIGYYGHHQNIENTEDQTHGEDFLAKLANDWEHEANLVKQQNIRVINLRTGLVLSKHGGALESMITPFKLGLGGKIGDGKQWMSWISLDDVCGSILFLIENKNAEGPYNLVSPNPATNEQFTQSLAKTLNRPTLLPLPKCMVKLIFGEMGELLLLNSIKVLPNKLQTLGYTFKHPFLEKTFEDLLDKHS